MRQTRLLFYGYLLLFHPMKIWSVSVMLLVGLLLSLLPSPFLLSSTINWLFPFQFPYLRPSYFFSPIFHFILFYFTCTEPLMGTWLIINMYGYSVLLVSFHPGSCKINKYLKNSFAIEQCLILTTSVLWTRVLELACVALLNIYHSYPSNQGKMVKSKLKNGVADILDNCLRFSGVLKCSIGVTYTKDNHPLGKLPNIHLRLSIKLTM